jgi:pimeloyl-ACP methyl ester carboxylesterase
MSMRRRTALRLGVATGAAGVAAAVPGIAPARAATPSGRLGEGDLSDEALVRSLPGFRNGYARVNGVRLHYVIGGQGAPLVLLPGYPETWWEYRKIMPALAARYQVSVVDLRGMGGSGKPQDGFDKRNMAKDIFELVRHLGHDQVNIAGHDIGSHVTFSFAANHPGAARRVAMLDVPHPNESIYSLSIIPRPGQPAFLWWFAFNQVKVLPEELLTGRFRLLIDTEMATPGLLADQEAISDRDREIYARAYDDPDAIRASNGWYQAFGQDIADLATYPVVRTPILAMYADVNVDGPPALLAGLKGTATDVTPLEIKNAGHYLAEDQPEAVIRGLTGFFG